MGNAHRQGWIWVLLCIGISFAWGISMGRGVDAWIDFRAVYAGARCLIHEHNPYNVADLKREYDSEDGKRPRNSPSVLQSMTLYVNAPPTFVFVAPFALLSWGPAHILWVLLTGCAFIAAILLMWNAGANYSPRVSAFLACVLAINCASIFSGGNTAGIVVGLCAIAVWCFLENRFVWVGVVCMGLSLAVKPHDSGFVWLYFLLVGGIQRKRALQSLVITAVIGLTAFLWLSHVAPSWMHDWNANLATISARGGINEPGPASVSGRSMFMVVDLQAAISIFRDEPGFYNAVSYAFCGAVLLVWAIWTLRTRPGIRKAWLALGAATAFTLLITYHRPWDAKLVMLAIPPCCMLWARRGWVGRIAFLITAAAILFEGDLPLSAITLLAASLKLSTAGLGGKLVSLVLLRPESLALVALGLFYLWAYLKAESLATEPTQEA